MPPSPQVETLTTFLFGDIVVVSQLLSTARLAISETLLLAIVLWLTVKEAVVDIDGTSVTSTQDRNQLNRLLEISITIVLYLSMD